MGWYRVGALVALLAVPAMPAAARPPQFFFWGNFPEAHEILDLEPGVSLEPVALAEDELPTRCRIRLREPLALVRDGVVVGSGRVREIRAGVVPRAGGDRIMYLLPGGLPDSLVIAPGPPFPSRDDPDFDLYVVGADSVAVIPEGPSRPLSAEEIAGLLEGAIDAGVVDTGHLERAMGPFADDHAPTRPLTDVAAWLQAGARPVAFEVPLPGATLAIESCGPHFLRVRTAGLAEPTYLRGSLDYFLRIDGRTYLVLRDGQPETGAWGYFVYELSPPAAPVRVYGDTSWST